MKKAAEADISGVSQNGTRMELTRLANQRELTAKATQAVPIRYNFATGAMDPEGFDYTRWKRYRLYLATGTAFGLRPPARGTGTAG